MKPRDRDTPAFQNIPLRIPEADRIRKAILGPGTLSQLAYDYAAAEEALRRAHRSGEESP